MIAEVAGARQLLCVFKLYECFQRGCPITLETVHGWKPVRVRIVTGCRSFYRMICANEKSLTYGPRHTQPEKFSGSDVWVPLVTPKTLDFPKLVLEGAEDLPVQWIPVVSKTLMRNVSEQWYSLDLEDGEDWIKTLSGLLVPGAAA